MSGEKLRVLVCGGRNYGEWRAVSRALTTLHEDRGIALIIHGGARGADELAGRWAFHQKVPQAVFPANWRFDGKAAGPIRNQAMLDHGKPDCVVAFPGGRGTAHMVKIAGDAGVSILQPTGDSHGTD